MFNKGLTENLSYQEWYYLTMDIRYIAIKREYK